MIMLRYIDPANFLYLKGRTNGTLQLQKRVAGVETGLTGTFTPNIQDGGTYRLLATWNGAVFKVTQNEVFAINYALSTGDATLFLGATKNAFALRNNSAGPTPGSDARISDIEVWS